MSGQHEPLDTEGPATKQSVTVVLILGIAIVIVIQ